MINKTNNIGLIGLGRIGARLAKRLSGSGWKLRVYDVDPDKIPIAAELSIPFVTSPSEIATDCSVVILSLPDGGSVTDVVAGKNGLLENSPPDQDRWCIDLSTLSVKTAISMAHATRGKRWSYLDAPISGGIWGADSGDLTVMAGGDHAAFAFLEPLLMGIGNHVVYVGDSGSGAMTKLLHNMVGEIQVHAFAEAFCAAARLGLDVRTVYTAFSTGMASSKVLTNLFRQRLFESPATVSVPLSNAWKDQRLLTEMAKDAGLALESPAQILPRIQGLMDSGHASQDVTSVLEYFAKRHGITFA